MMNVWRMAIGWIEGINDSHKRVWLHGGRRMAASNNEVASHSLGFLKLNTSFAPAYPHRDDWLSLQVTGDCHSPTRYLSVAGRARYRWDRTCLLQPNLLLIDTTCTVYFEMTSSDAGTSLNTVSVITLFVEDLPKSKAFYLKVFSAKVAFEDEQSAGIQLSNLTINLLQASEGAVLVNPAPVGGPDVGRRFQLTIFVDDLDGAMKHLAAAEVELLTGPQLQPWGVRTVTFTDPAGHSWEIAQPVKA